MQEVSKITMSVGGGEPVDITSAIKSRMKQTEADTGVISRVMNAAGDEILSFIERAEELEAEKKEIGEGLKEVWSEAKGRGYDTKALREIVKLRRMNKQDRDEAQAVLDLYKSAIGMA